jgi:hypothetical protein
MRLCPSCIAVGWHVQAKPISATFDGGRSRLEHDRAPSKHVQAREGEWHSRRHCTGLNMPPNAETGLNMPPGRVLSRSERRRCFSRRRQPTTDRFAGRRNSRPARCLYRRTPIGLRWWEALVSGRPKGEKVTMEARQKVGFPARVWEETRDARAERAAAPFDCRNSPKTAIAGSKGVTQSRNPAKTTGRDCRFSPKTAIDWRR